jgi:hypothetical protein
MYYQFAFNFKFHQFPPSLDRDPLYNIIFFDVNGNQQNREISVEPR